MSSSSLCSNMSKSNPLSAAAVQPAAPAALSDLQQAKAAFLNSELSSSYGYQGWLEQHWWAEVGARFGPGQHYLDYTGAGQFTTSQLAAAFQELTTTGLGNPHSNNPSSTRATQEVAAARALVLAHFNASAEEYHVIFTKGATEGLKMVGEFFPWSGTPAAAGSCSSCGHTSTVPTQQQAPAAAAPAHRSHFIYTQANHKSLLGIGAYAKQAGAQLHCVISEQMDAWLATPGCAVPEAPSRRSSCCGELVGAAPEALPVRADCSAVRTSRSHGLAGTASSEEPQQPATPALSSSSSNRSGSDLGDGAAETQQDLLAAARSALDMQVTAPGHEQDQHSSSSDSSSDSDSDSSSGSDSSSSASTCHLVAWPAKDNYEGRLYPQEWVKQVHAKSDAHNQYFVLLDAAAYAATHALDMAAVQPDFLTVSFYKLFGYPSGLGALLVRKQAAQRLRKVYFGGGSVSYCTAEDAWHVLSPAPAGYEDGTLGFLNIACLKHGFAQLAALGGMRAISAHVESLRQWTYSQLLQLRHSNGQPLVRLFGRHAEGPRQQAGIFQFQVLTPEGDRVPGSLVEAAASAAGLHLRSGCNCNPGRCMANLGITPQQERERAAKSHKGPILVVMRPQGCNSGCSSSSPEAVVRLAGEQQQQQQDGEPQLEAVPLPLGSVRVSLGAYSTFEDCYALVRLLAGTFADFEVYQRELAAGVKLVRVMDDAEHAVKLRAAVALAQ